jgi:hypothetical protein
MFYETILISFLIYVEQHALAVWVFGCALILLIISLGLSIREIQISVQTLEYHLGDMESYKNENN